MYACRLCTCAKPIESWLQVPVWRFKRVYIESWCAESRFISTEYVTPLQPHHVRLSVCTPICQESCWPSLIAPLWSGDEGIRQGPAKPQERTKGEGNNRTWGLCWAVRRREPLHFTLTATFSCVPGLPASCRYSFRLTHFSELEHCRKHLVIISVHKSAKLTKVQSFLRQYNGQVIPRIFYSLLKFI